MTSAERDIQPILNVYDYSRYNLFSSQIGWAGFLPTLHGCGGNRRHLATSIFLDV